MSFLTSLVLVSLSQNELIAPVHCVKCISDCQRGVHVDRNSVGVACSRGIPCTLTASGCQIPPRPQQVYILTRHAILHSCSRSSTFLHRDKSFLEAFLSHVCGLLSAVVVQAAPVSAFGCDSAIGSEPVPALPPSHPADPLSDPQLILQL